ncbi:hypothetical protein KCU81_g5079, partial [Aureobasidium melanogenum]
MREQHEQLTEDVKEEFTTVKKEQTLINIKVDTYKTSEMSRREFKIVRDTMRELEAQGVPIHERFGFCEQSFKEKGFERTPKACKSLWYEKFDPEVRCSVFGRSSWSKEEHEILQSSMKELTGDDGLKRDRHRICQKRLEENGFKRSRQACVARYNKQRISEILNGTGEHAVDNIPEAIHDEPFKPSDRTLQNSFPASAATANARPANFRCYEWMQMNFEPDPAVLSHTVDQMALDKSLAMSVSQLSNDEEEPSGDVIAADLADAVAEGIAEHCEETTTGWSHMDIGFRIADSD